MISIRGFVVVNRNGNLQVKNKNLYSHMDLNLSTDDLTVMAVNDVKDEPFLFKYK